MRNRAGVCSKVDGWEIVRAATVVGARQDELTAASGEDEVNAKWVSRDV